MIMLAGLCLMELPNRTIRLCDGGFVNWAGVEYHSSDDVFGTIESFQPVEDASGDSAPDGQLVFLPNENAAASQLSNQAFQDSRVRFYIAEIDEQTGIVIGNPELMADLLIDTSVMTYQRGTRKLVINFGSFVERAFLINRANGITKRFHNLRYPNERGLDNAIGVTVPSAWGAESPPQSGGFSSSRGGNSFGFSPTLHPRLVQRQ